MQELLQAAFSPPNLLYTILLLVVLLYWLSVFIGALDLEFLDVDLDLDPEVDLELEVDVDADIEVDAEVEGTGTNSPNFIIQALSFFNLGKVPFMVFASFLILSMWLISMVGNAMWGGVIPFFPLILVVPNVIISLFLTKIFSWPFAQLFSKIKHETASGRDLVGKIATLTMAAEPGRISQVDLVDDDTHYLLSVRSKDEASLSRGQQVLLVEYNAQTDEYLITSFDH